MKYLLIIVCIGLIPFLSSCPGKSREDTCGNSSLLIVGVGFDSSDFNRGVLVRYRQNNLFDSTVDSATIWVNTIKGDTISVFTNNFPNLPPGFDYQMKLPAINKTYSITGITQTGLLHKVLPYVNPPASCANRIIACKVNGNAATVDTSVYSSWPIPDTLYLAK